MSIWVLDPFGGGSESGYIGKDGVKESDIVLEAVLEAKRHLERNGEKVYVTRNSDRYIDIDEREKLINQYKAEVLVIFHMSNDDNNKNINGVKVVIENDEEDGMYLAQLIESEMQSQLRIESKGIVFEEGPYKSVNCKTIVVYGEYLSCENSMEKFDNKKYGYAVAKACLAYKDKVLLEEPKSEPKKTQKRSYRVCIGYYKDYDTAMDEVIKLNKEGIMDAYVVPYEG